MSENDPEQAPQLDSKLQECLTSLQAAKRKVAQGLAHLKALHKQSKGAASPKTAELLMAVEGLSVALELQQALSNAFNDYVFTLAMNVSHQVTTLTEALKGKGVVSEEDIAAHSQAISEQMRAATKARQAEAFDEALAPPEGQEPEPADATSNIIVP